MSISPTEGVKGQALDVLGKYESDGVGGYNAVNQIGIKNGRGVLGYSGDYRNLGSKPLTRYDTWGDYGSPSSKTWYV